MTGAPARPACDHLSMSATQPTASKRPTHAELTALLDAPDLTKRETRELKRAIRFQRRVEVWEERRAAPQPVKPHRVVISVLLMVAMLWVLYLLITGPPS